VIQALAAIGIGFVCRSPVKKPQGVIKAPSILSLMPKNAAFSSRKNTDIGWGSFPALGLGQYLSALAVGNAACRIT